MQVCIGIGLLYKNSHDDDSSKILLFNSFKDMDNQKFKNKLQKDINVIKYPTLQKMFNLNNSSLNEQYRRGILAILNWCIGKNNILTPIKNNLKWISLNSLSMIIPVKSGNQW